jgi:transcription elongation factor Elf1
MNEIIFIEDIPETKEKYICPYCNEEYYDINDKLFFDLDNKNINYVVIICKTCGYRFGVYYEYNGRIKTFQNPLKLYQPKKNYDKFINYIKKKYNNNYIIDIE